MLEMLRNDPETEIAGLMTTISHPRGRVAMHGVREELLRRQAESLGLPLRIISIPEPCSNQEYESIMGGMVASLREEGITQVAFGDLFLEDIRAYRESRLEGTGLSPIFPFWNIPTKTLAARMIGEGIRAVITCVDSSQLDPAFIGREFDSSFLADLPAGIDPCGERGEFHSFVYDAPGFARPVVFTPGEISERDGFVYLDLVPGGED